MNIFSVVIVLLILMMGIIGWKRGIIKELVVLVGTVLVYFLAFCFKDYLAAVLIEHLPFFNFRIPLGNLTSLNILFYQLIAFLILVIVFRFILKIVINVSTVLSKLANATIILALPNKLLGLLAGLIEGYILMFVILNVAAIPLSGNTLFMESNVRKYIVNETPILKDSIGGLNIALESILNLDSEDNINSNNLKAIDILLETKVITTDFLEEIIESDKLTEIIGIEEIITKYKEG